MEFVKKYRKELKTELENRKSVENQKHLKKITQAFPHLPENLIFAIYYAANYEVERCFNALIVLESGDDIDEELFMSERKFCNLLVDRLQLHFEKSFDIETEKMKNSLKIEHKGEVTYNHDEEAELDISEESSDCIEELEDNIAQPTNEEYKHIDYGSCIVKDWASVAQKGQKNDESSLRTVLQPHKLSTTSSNVEKVNFVTEVEIPQMQSSSESFFDKIRNATFKLIEGQPMLDNSQKSNVTILKEQSPVSSMSKTENGFKYKPVESTRKQQNNKREIIPQVSENPEKENSTPENQAFELTVPVNMNKLERNNSKNDILRNSTLENKESEFQGKRTPKKQNVPVSSLNQQLSLINHKDIKTFSPIKDRRQILPQLPSNNDPRLQNTLKGNPNSTRSHMKGTIDTNENSS